MVPEASRLQLSAAAQESGAGALGGALGVLAGHPLDTLRVRLQQPGAPSGLRAVWAATVAGEGMGALFKGLSVPLLFAALTNAACFHTYAETCRLLAGHAPQTPPPPDGVAPRAPYAHIFLSGCVAGFITTALVTPIDLLKCQLQARSQAHTRAALRLLLTRAPRRCAWAEAAAGRSRSRRPSWRGTGCAGCIVARGSRWRATRPALACTTSCTRRVPQCGTHSLRAAPH